MKKFRALMRAVAFGAPAVLGLALVAVGIGMVYIPAGLIAAGAALIWIDSRL